MARVMAVVRFWHLLAVSVSVVVSIGMVVLVVLAECVSFSNISVDAATADLVTVISCLFCCRN